MSAKRPLCYNRAAFKSSVDVQAGWRWTVIDRRLTQVPVMERVPDPMSKDCKQWGDTGEARLKNWDCDGCKWKPAI